MSPDPEDETATIGIGGLVNGKRDSSDGSPVLQSATLPTPSIVVSPTPDDDDARRSEQPQEGSKERPVEIPE